MHLPWLLVAALGGCGGPEPEVPAAAPATPPPAPAFAGSAACARCHPAQADAWSGSHHALAERPANAEADALAGFDLPGATLGDVVGVLGVDPLWQPLLRAPGGRVQVSSRAFHPATGTWFDVFDDPREPGDWGHWTGRGMTWNSQCAACHDTGVRRNWDAATDTYATTVAERGVGCEACHGPSGAHAADPAVPTAGPRDREAVADTCASCHVRWTPATDAFHPGDALLDHGLPALPGAGDDWRPDGGVRAESFEAVAFRLSRMHAAGVRCTDCHDVHAATPKADGDALCAGCHAATPDHDHHEPGRVACVDCHMPVTVYMGRDPRHDHGFRVPDPVLDAELGQRSACDACHDGRVVEAAGRWWTPREDLRRRARALAAVRAGAEDAGARVAEALAAEAHPGWRAVLLGVSDDVSARLAALDDPDPWVRRGAVTDAPLDGAMIAGLRRALADPVRAVRIEAALSLMPVLPPTDPAATELRRHLERLGDHAGAAFTLGSWWAGHGRHAEAIPWLQRTTTLDPASAEGWRSLAVAQAADGRSVDAVATLDRAVARLPDDAELHFLRGLALATDRPDDAISAFRRALALAPDHGRAAYNLGLALAGRGDAEGLALLERAAALRPDDPAPPYALATLRLEAGDRTGARAAAEAALARDPHHDGARRVLAALER